MSNSVEIDASKSVEKDVEKTASDFVLGVFWTYAVKPEISFREFKTLVEVWLKIREMEAPEPAPSPQGEGFFGLSFARKLYAKRCFSKNFVCKLHFGASV